MQVPGPWGFSGALPNTQPWVEHEGELLQPSLKAYIHCLEGQLGRARELEAQVDTGLSTLLFLGEKTESLHLLEEPGCNRRKLSGRRQSSNRQSRWNRGWGWEAAIFSMHSKAFLAFLSSIDSSLEWLENGEAPPLPRDSCPSTSPSSGSASQAPMRGCAAM